MRLPSGDVRVAIVSPYSLSFPGGVQGQVLALARALRAAKHDAVVLGPVDGAVPGAPSSSEVIGLGRSVPVPANGSTARLALGPLAQRRAWRALGDWRPDVVHLHEPLAPGPVWAALARPEPKVGTFHRAGAVRGRGVLAPAARVLAARLAARTAVSDEAGATAVQLAGGHYEIIGNGVELERFAFATPWPTTRPTILFVGRHEPRKGLDVLLAAFSALDSGVDAELWVAGHGPATDGLRRRFPGVPGRVEWLGVVDDDELASRLAGAHIVCAPSLGGESFGIVLVEAMASRAVVVASDLPGYRAVVGAHGVLVAPGDVVGLGGALEGVLRDVAVARGLAAPAALDDAVGRAARWSMAEVAARYVEVYRAVDFGGA